jgi:hypothetical protein
MTLEQAKQAQQKAEANLNAAKREDGGARRGGRGPPR